MIRIGFFCTLFLTLIFCSQEIGAQQLLHRTQFMLHDFLLNPAAAGSRSKAIVQTGRRVQWQGIIGEPVNSFVSFHSPIEARGKTNVHHGMGIHVVDEEIVPFSAQHMMMAYSYHYQLFRDATVSLGVAAGINQFRFNGAQMEFADEPDPLGHLATGNILPDMQAGVLLYSRTYFASFNTFQVFKNRVKGIGGGDSKQTRMRRHYYISAGKKFATGPRGRGLWVFIPSAMITYSSGAPMAIDLNMRYVYNENFWVGMSFRLQDAVAAMIGFNLWRLGVGYSYDYTVSALRKFSNNSHEVVLELRLKDSRERNKPCHAYY